MSAIATPYLPINRAAINAANAQFSTGPTSTEGKERIRFNALKTGIYARTVVLPGEDHAAYEALGAGVIETYQPVTANERELVLAIQNATWRMSRAVELEFSLFAIGAQQQLESIDAQFPGQPDHARYALARGAAYMLHSRTFDQLSRQEARYQRVLDRAVKDLRALIAQRPQNGPDPIPPPAVAAAPASGPTPVPPPVRPFVSPSAAPSVPSTGFVPSKYPADMPLFEGKRQGERRRRWLRENGYKGLN